MKSRRLLTATGMVLLLAILPACHHRRPKSSAPMEIVPVATLYAKGRKAMQKHKEATARKYFDQIVLREDAGKYKNKATIAIADSYMADHTIDAYAEAISRYRSFLAFHPTHPRAAYCQYQIGHAYFGEINTPDRDITPATSALRAFRAVVDNYPKSSYSKKAQVEIKAVRNVLAAHEIKVGDWYLKDGHPKGAIARYRGVLKKYPHYWNIPLVQHRLAEALSAGGRNREALLYFKLITTEVPGTKLAKSARKDIEKIDRREEVKIPATVKKHWWQFWKRIGRKNPAFEAPLIPPKQNEKRKNHWWQFWR